jgi:L-amino acid N-acyltransferase YncA
LIIESMQAQHWPAVRAIYQAGIDTGHATFESRAPDSFDQWLVGHEAELCLVAIDAGTPAGWAALGRVSSRCVYAGVGEVSVYVAPSCQRRGVGRQLLTALIAQSEERGLLDAAGWHLPGEQRQHRSASGTRFRSAGAAPPPGPNELRAIGRTVA